MMMIDDDNDDDDDQLDEPYSMNQAIIEILWLQKVFLMNRAYSDFVF